VDQLYPASAYPTVFARLAAIEGDRDYTCQVRHYADLLSGSGIGSLYVYQLRKVLPYTNPQSFLGAFHTSDVRLMMPRESSAQFAHCLCASA
jgi:hypothetical protein